jgi:hypothetical protein
MVLCFKICRLLHSGKLSVCVSIRYYAYSYVKQSVKPLLVLELVELELGLKCLFCMSLSFILRKPKLSSVCM